MIAFPAVEDCAILGRFAEQKAMGLGTHSKNSENIPVPRVCASKYDIPGHELAEREGIERAAPAVKMHEQSSGLFHSFSIPSAA